MEVMSEGISIVGIHCMDRGRVGRQGSILSTTLISVEIGLVTIDRTGRVLAVRLILCR